MNSIRVLLVDDNREFIEAASRFLASDPQVEVVGQSLSSQAALDQVAELKPDLVLMDLAMPDMNGLEATRRVKQMPDAPQVIVLTLHDSLEYRAAAQAARVDGFLAKSDLGVQLLPLIQKMFRKYGNQSQAGKRRKPARSRTKNR